MGQSDTLGVRECIRGITSINTVIFDECHIPLLYTGNVGATQRDVMFRPEYGVVTNELLKLSKNAIFLGLTATVSIADESEIRGVLGVPDSTIFLRKDSIQRQITINILVGKSTTRAQFIALVVKLTCASDNVKIIIFVDTKHLGLVL